MTSTVSPLIFSASGAFGLTSGTVTANQVYQTSYIIGSNQSVQYASSIYDYNATTSTPTYTATPVPMIIVPSAGKILSISVMFSPSTSSSLLTNVINQKTIDNFPLDSIVITIYKSADSLGNPGLYPAVNSANSFNKLSRCPSAYLDSSDLYTANVYPGTGPLYTSLTAPPTAANTIFSDGFYPSSTTNPGSYIYSLKSTDNPYGNIPAETTMFVEVYPWDRLAVRADFNLNTGTGTARSITGQLSVVLGYYPAAKGV